MDHFGSTGNRTFKQRYYVMDDYWAKQNGPFILCIAGEGPQEGPAGVNDELIALAKQNRGVMLTLDTASSASLCCSLTFTLSICTTWT